MAFVASNLSGIAMAAFMCPFDVISTRLYNQGIYSNNIFKVLKYINLYNYYFIGTGTAGKGRLYNGVIDCGLKIIRSEGIRGIYKGVGPFYLRVAPHTVLCLIFWDHFKNIFQNKWWINQKISQNLIYKNKIVNHWSAKFRTIES